MTCLQIKLIPVAQLEEERIFLMFQAGFFPWPLLLRTHHMLIYFISLFEMLIFIKVASNFPLQLSKAFHFDGMLCSLANISHFQSLGQVFCILIPYQPSLEFKWWPVRKLYMENLKWRNKHIIFEFRISAPIQKTWSFVQSLWNQMGVSPPIRGKWWVSIIWPWRWLCVATPSHQSCKQLELILLITH